MSVTLKVKLFGPQADLAQAEALSVELDALPATAAAVLDAVGRAAPALAESLSVSRLAVNQEYAPAQMEVGADDELALIGMVAGG